MFLQKPTGPTAIAIGVQVSGGAPGDASVIGRQGNQFEYYLIALGDYSSPVNQLPRGTTKSTPQGLPWATCYNIPSLPLCRPSRAK